jgi:hypothetical protein
MPESAQNPDDLEWEVLVGEEACHGLRCLSSFGWHSIVLSRPVALP